MADGHGQAMGARKGDDGRIILFRGAKLNRELVRGQEAVVIGAGRVVKLMEQIGQACAVPQGQTDVQAQAIPARCVADWREIGHCCKALTVNYLKFRRRAWNGGQNQG